MKGRGAKASERFFVSGGGVAFVLGEAVAGVKEIEGIHDLIAEGLGDDGGRCDVVAEVIALDNGLTGKGIREGELAIDQDKLGVLGEALSQVMKGKLHRVEGGLEDIALIDLDAIDDANADGKGFFVDHIEESAACLFLELFGIVQAVDQEIGGQHDSSGDNGASEGASASFIDADDACDTLFVEIFFHPTGGGKEGGL